MKTMVSEYLSRDLLDECHLRLFAPLRFWQMIFGACRVDAKDRFVTAPTWGQKAYTVIILLLASILHFYVIYYHVSQLCNYQSMYFICVLCTALNFAFYFLNIIHVRFINNESNVKFYIKTQEIDRKLKISDNNPINNTLYNINILAVVFLVGVTVISVTFVLTNNIDLFVPFAGLLLCQFANTLEWMFCSNIIVYFYQRLRFINAIIRNHLKGLPSNVEVNSKFLLPTRKNMRSLAANIHDFNVSETDDYLKDIFDELFRFQELYRWQVLLFCFKFVSMALLGFEFVLLALQKNMLRWIETIMLPSLTAFDLIMIMVICIRCEAFSTEIRDIKRLSTTILSIYYEGPLREKAVKMLKIIKEKPPQISVYDMWNMDAATMLNMINIVTTLLVTLLQFALL